MDSEQFDRKVMELEFTPWIKEAPWGAARKARKEHVALYHWPMPFGLLDPHTLRWAHDRLCPVCMKIDPDEYEAKWKAKFSGTDSGGNE
jgi:hypothetical protein